MIDTHVFNRSLIDGQEYRNVYLRLLARCDRLLVNSGIMEEYGNMATRAGVTRTYILEEVFPHLRRQGKLQMTGNRPVRVGSAQDRPFIGGALEGRARYLVSNDPGFRTRSVRRALQRTRVEVLSPEEYAALP